MADYQLEIVKELQTLIYEDKKRRDYIIRSDHPPLSMLSQVSSGFL